jgi:hypothetical protein
VGTRLSAVEFHGSASGPILLRFSEGRLEVNAPARLRHGSADLDARGESGRLALRERVSRCVARVTLEPGNVLELTLDDGAALVVSLRPADRPGGDAAGFFDESWTFEAY